VFFFCCPFFFPLLFYPILIGKAQNACAFMLNTCVCVCVCVYVYVCVCVEYICM